MEAPKSRPTFSVVVPAFNSAERIALTLNSVLGQTRTDLELIVVDDGSSDETAAVAERLAAADPRLRVSRQANQGTVAARNAGLALAAGRYVSFLDDDDLWLPGYLSAVGARFDAASGAGLVFSDAWVVDEVSGLVGGLSAHDRFARPIRGLPASIPASQLERALLRVNFITTCATTVSGDALDAVGGFDLAIKGSDDWDLWLRIAGAGFAGARIEGRLAALRKRADSVGSDSLMMAANSRLVLERALERGVAASRSRRIAVRHASLIGAEAAALRAGSRPRRLLAGVARRLGRKRLRMPAPPREEPPAELRALFDRGRLPPAEDQREASSSPEVL